jgi:hypothetical protein
MALFAPAFRPELRQRLTVVAAAVLVAALLGQAPAGALPPDGSTPIVVTNPEGNSPEGEEPENAYDGNLDTKWLDRNFEGGDDGNPSILLIEFCVPVTFNRYQWITAKDEGAEEEKRQPLVWEVQTSSDGEIWTPVDAQDISADWPSGLGNPGFGPGFTIGPFNLETSTTTARVRWVITEIEGGSRVQAAEFVLLNGEVVLPNLNDQFSCDEPESVTVQSAISVACDPLMPQVGRTITCTVTGGDPGIDILWRAAYNPVFAEAGVTLDDTGTGEFSFVVPAAALGQELTVELVEWLVPVSLGAVGGPVPASIPAGSGPAPVAMWSLVMVALAGGLVLRRMSTVGVRG